MTPSLPRVLPLFALGACASTAPPPPAAGPTSGLEAGMVGDAPVPLPGPAPLAAEPEPAPCEALVAADKVKRTAVVTAANGGVGLWLSRGARVEARIERGRFGGWIVRSLYPGDACYEKIDLRVGDVVTRVNGRSVERPDQAHEVLQALRTAPAIVVDYERSGQKRILRLAIVDR